VPPFIVNLDSAFDWTEDVRQAWEQLDWSSIYRAVAPAVPIEEWTRRRDALTLIGLVSSLIIDRSYAETERSEKTDKQPESDDWLTREWRDRQRGRTRGGER
jgi:hypothetical protein